MARVKDERMWIVFDCLPGGPDQPANFVEVENGAGESLGPDDGVEWNTEGEFPRLGPFVCENALLDARAELAAARERVKELETALAPLVSSERLSVVPTFWWTHPPNRATSDVMEQLKEVRRVYVGGKS